MKVEKKVENREVVTVKPVDIFVLTLDRDEADVLIAVAGSLALKYDGPVRRVTNKLYDQLKRAGLRGVLSDADALHYSAVVLKQMTGSNNPIIRQANYF